MMTQSNKPAVRADDKRSGPPTRRRPARQSPSA